MRYSCGEDATVLVAKYQRQGWNQSKAQLAPVFIGVWNWGLCSVPLKIQFADVSIVVIPFFCRRSKITPHSDVTSRALTSGSAPCALTNGLRLCIQFRMQATNKIKNSTPPPPRPRPLSEWLRPSHLKMTMCLNKFLLVPRFIRTITDTKWHCFICLFYTDSGVRSRRWEHAVSAVTLSGL